MRELWEQVVNAINIHDLNGAISILTSITQLRDVSLETRLEAYLQRSELLASTNHQRRSIRDLNSILDLTKRFRPISENSDIFSYSLIALEGLAKLQPHIANDYYDSGILLSSQMKQFDPEFAIKEIELYEKKGELFHSEDPVKSLENYIKAIELIDVSKQFDFDEAQQSRLKVLNRKVSYEAANFLAFANKIELAYQNFLRMGKYEGNLSLAFFASYIGYESLFYEAIAHALSNPPVYADDHITERNESILIFLLSKFRPKMAEA